MTIQRDRDHYIIPAPHYPLKVHLGCWDRPLADWINVDKVYMPGVDLVEDARFLRSFRTRTVDVIYASHVLDEISRWEYMAALKRWYDVLKIGGKLYLSIPDFEAIVSRYQQTGDLRELQGLLHGGQDHDGWTRSYSWDLKLMREDLSSIGFKDVQRYKWQLTPFSERDDYSQAYLPRDKENGMQMSLNVLATK